MDDEERKRKEKEEAKRKEKSFLNGQIRAFEKVRPNYLEYEVHLTNLLQAMRSHFAPDGIVQVRTKDVESFFGKIFRKRDQVSDPVNEFTDLVGGRIITTSRDEVEAICDFIENSGIFEIDWVNSVDISQRLRPTEFGYRSVHYIVSLSNSAPAESLSRIGYKEKQKVRRKIQKLKAEIQVRTTLEHAWSDFNHRMIYKKEFSLPDRWEREAAKLAAVLEAADSMMLGIKQGIQWYEQGFGPLLPRNDLNDEITRVKELYEIRRQQIEKMDNRDKTGILKVLERLTGLLILFGEFNNAISLIREVPLDQRTKALNRNLGFAVMQRMPPGSISLDALSTFELASQNDAIAAVAYIDYLVKNDRPKAEELLHSTYLKNPKDGSVVSRYLIHQVSERRSIESLSVAKPVIENAIERCRELADIGSNLPFVFYQIGLLRLLEGKPYDALNAYSKAISMTPSYWMIEDARNLLSQIGDEFRREIPGYDWVDRLLLLGSYMRKDDIPKDQETQNTKHDRDEAMKAEIVELRKERYQTGEKIFILSGGCDERFKQDIAKYEEKLVDAFEGYRGLLISGGTTAGIAGIAGNIGSKYKNNIQTVGYVPAQIPSNESKDKRYSKTVETDEDNFSPMEPLQFWTDVIASGISPSEITLLGINGGNIAAAEFRIALALGARVAVVPESGRAAESLAVDPDWKDNPKCIVLPDEYATLQSLISGDSRHIDPAVRDIIAKNIHEDYRKDQIARILDKEPNLKKWKELSEEFKESNRLQADDIMFKLEKIGYSTRKPEGIEIEPVVFSPDEVEILAELEHGRWNAERLLKGWKLGPKKDIDRKISPYLVTWQNLPENIKEYDREAVRNIPQNLAKVGIEVYKR